MSRSGSARGEVRNISPRKPFDKMQGYIFAYITFKLHIKPYQFWSLFFLNKKTSR